MSFEMFVRIMFTFMMALLLLLLCCVLTLDLTCCPFTLSQRQFFFTFFICFNLKFERGIEQKEMLFFYFYVEIASVRNMKIKNIHFREWGEPYRKANELNISHINIQSARVWHWHKGHFRPFAFISNGNNFLSFGFEILSFCNWLLFDRIVEGRSAHSQLQMHNYIYIYIFAWLWSVTLIASIAPKKPLLLFFL